MSHWPWVQKPFPEVPNLVNIAFFAAFQLAAATVYTIHAEVFGGEEHVCLNFSPVSKWDKDVSFAATQHCLQFLVCLL